MRRRSLSLAAATALVVSGFSLSAHGAEGPVAKTTPSVTKPTPDRDTRPMVSRGLIVKTTTSSPSSALVTATGKALGRVAGVKGTKKVSGKISTIDFDEIVDADDAAKVAKEVSKRSDVEWASPNTLRYASVVPSPVTTNDPYFPSLRHLWDNRSATSGSPSPWPNGGYSTKAPSLWRATKGSSDVHVAVLDTGITSHPDLDNQVVPGYDFVSNAPVGTEPAGYNEGDETAGWDNDNTDPGDWATTDACGPKTGFWNSSWHGTHVAGIVAAEANNSIGVAGVAPGVKVQPLRVLGHCGGWDSDIASAIIYAAGGTVPGVSTPNPTPAKVINVSIGSTYFPDPALGEDEDDAVAAAQAACPVFESAMSQARALGAVTVVAAGNDTAPAEWTVPGVCDGAFSVGATGQRGLAAWYSNWGPSIDLSAPGGDNYVDSGLSIVSTVNAGTTTAGTPTYGRYEGTSMAAPAVSGGAALLYSLGLSTPDKVEKGLRSAGRKFPAWDERYSRYTKAYGPDFPIEINCEIPGDGLPSTYYCGDGILDLGTVQANITAPSVAGSPRIGQTLTAAGVWNGSARGLTYQWLRNDVPITGATASTYKVKPDWDLGKKLSVKVTPKVTAYADLNKTSGQTIDVLQALSWTKTVLPTTVASTSQASIAITVGATGVTPTGPLAVFDGTTQIATSALYSTSGGKRTIKLPKLAKGVHKITVVYGGSTNVKTSTSVVRSITSK